MRINSESMPNIVGFLCNWCSYAGADLAGASRMEMPPCISVVRVMCSSRVDPVLVLNALFLGADGVLVAGCHPGDCHYEQGNYYTRRRFALLKRLIETLELEPKRIQLCWISASEGKKYAEVVNRFAQMISEIGPNPMSRDPLV